MDLHTKQKFLKNYFPDIKQDLFDEILEKSEVQEIESNVKIVRQDQYIKWIPIVIEGRVKVFTRYEEKELLLYYILPEESCIMSFAAALQNSQSKVFALTEEKTKLLLLPAFEMNRWVLQSQNFNLLFFKLFNKRYMDLLDTINHLVYHKMDIRLRDYLVKKAKISGSNTVKISHRQIADELGTAREVISRVMKKLEKENIVFQENEGIKILDL